MQRIAQAQYQLTLEMVLDICASFAIDIGHDHPNLLLNCLDYISFISTLAGPDIANEIHKAVMIFRSRYIRYEISESVVAKLAANFPWTCSILNKWEFYQFHSFNSAINSSSCESGHYIFGPHIGFSFGSNYYPLSYLMLRRYLRNNSRLTIYCSPRELRTFPRLLEMISTNFSSVSVFDITNHAFSMHDLQEYARLTVGGRSDRHLFKEYYNSIRQPDVDLFSGLSLTSQSSITQYQRDSLEYDPLALIGKEIVEQLNITPSPSVEKMVQTALNKGKPIISLINRDEHWVGGGQPWRDTSIDSFEDLITTLLANDYCVFRNNSVGSESRVSHPGFLDMSLGNFTPEDQLFVASHSNWLIGSTTGVSCLFSVILRKNCLFIDGAHLVESEPRGGRRLFSPKTIKIIDMDKFNNTKPSRLLEVIFREVWTDVICNEIGITIESLTKGEIVKRSLAAIQKSKPRESSYSSLKLQAHFPCCHWYPEIILDQYSFHNIRHVMSCHRKFQLFY